MSDYLTRMARDGEWGDHHTLQAIGWEFEVHIKVMKMLAGGMGFLPVGNLGPNVTVILLSLEHSHCENCIKGYLMVSECFQHEVIAPLTRRRRVVSPLWGL